MDYDTFDSDFSIAEPFSGPSLSERYAAPRPPRGRPARRGSGGATGGAVPPPPSFDSVPLPGDAVPLEGPGPRLDLDGAKALFVLFLLYLLVASSMFTDHVLPAFGSSTMHGREVTTFGTAVSAAALVSGFAAMSYLIQQKII
jgi:hypothetical protein